MFLKTQNMLLATSILLAVIVARGPVLSFQHEDILLDGYVGVDGNHELRIEFVFTIRTYMPPP